MDTTTSLKMTSLAVQSLFSYVEEENLAAIKAHLDKFKDVDSRSDVSHALISKSEYEVMRGSLRSCNKCFVGKWIIEYVVKL